MSFGLNYMGSKNRIAPELIRKLPVGKRLVDLFGGGFAVAHCAALAGKWRTVLYNDVNPLVVQLVKDALAGKYDEGVFKPEFISRERFFAEKDTCGYVKWGWSFGGNGEKYCYSVESEPTKHSVHNWVVFNQKDKLVTELFGDAELPGCEIQQRYYALLRLRRERLSNGVSREHAEMLAHIRQVENLERLFRWRYIGSIRHTPLASKIEVTCADYCHYVHKTGDVVYCDIPYEGTDSEYCKGFCNQTFYEWALSRNYPVYVSSYAIDHPAAKEVWSTRLRVLSQGSAFKRYSTERLYVFNSP